MLITRAEVAGAAPVCLRIERGRIAAVDERLDRRPGEEVLDAAGGALLPGLHDHHLHLFALAAALRSAQCGPPAVRDRAGLARALREAPCEDGWVRGVGYHESVAGPLDRDALDALRSDTPVRVQHRSGALWMLSSAGVERLGLDRGADAPGVEREPRGRATGRLFRLDAWLRPRWRTQGPPSLAEVGRVLSRAGVTGATDATAANAEPELGAFTDAVRKGDLPQRLLLLGAPDLPCPRHPRLARGAVKRILDEGAPEDADELEASVRAAHASGRPVAIHCATRAELWMALGALEAAGALPRDRIEHASVAPPEALPSLARLGLTVVTQPSFVRERGDAYAVEVDPSDRPWLYRCRGLLAAGVGLGGSTDAPFGEPDPWLAMQAAVDRRTRDGLTMGAEERLTPERALALFTTPLERPGGAPRRIAPGAPADLCLLHRPWARARDLLSRDLVAATWCAGRLVWRRG